MENFDASSCLLRLGDKGRHRRVVVVVVVVIIATVVVVVVVVIVIVVVVVVGGSGKMFLKFRTKILIGGGLLSFCWDECWGQRWLVMTSQAPTTSSG